MNKQEAYAYVEKNFSESNYINEIFDCIEYNMTDDELSVLDETSLHEYVSQIELECRVEDYID